MKLLLILIFILGVSACVPQSSGKKGSRSSSASVAENPDSEPTAMINSDSVFWYSELTELDNLIIDSNTQANIYLRGSSVETFLVDEDDTDQKYCMVITFDDVTMKPQLRVRALPVSVYTSVGLERFLRIEFPETDYNSATCTGIISGVSTAFNAYDPSVVCPTCTGIFNGSSISLYRSNGTTITDDDLIEKVGLSSLDFSALTFRINPQENTTDPGASCNNTSCQTQGYDCCLDGQCVNDGEAKPNPPSAADADYTNYLIALQDVATNSLNYSNYPQYYYVCAGTIAPTPTPTATPNQEEIAYAALKEFTKEYLCILCDATSGSESTHADCSTTISLASGDSTTYAASMCDIYDNGIVDDYTIVMNKVVDKCGCDRGGTNYDDNCSGFSLTKVANVAGVVSSIECVDPVTSTDPTPFQILNLTLDTKTAPHRFYRADTGDAVDDIRTLQELAPTPAAEGTQFFYADPASKTIPINGGSFNMNSITGQFEVALDQAHPAKVVDIALDELYVISATSGYYTQCANCARDKWFNLFSASPPNLVMGKGLQSIGHTTSRDVGSTNYSFGNYEDTIFGRACWIPPTMIPFTHKAESNLVTQRTNRLKTQAALFMNGYQRDWYGFNKGALIGSFNGVSWFAIGKGRIIKSKSRKLFLAINAPFADLATPSSFNVHIVRDQSGESVAAQYDYDPDLTWNHPEQTEAATCQRYHMCSNDRDCVTKLGWEYMCANTASYKTNWPNFNAEAIEDVNFSNSYSYTQILAGKFNSGGSSMRCVYRGAGSPCKKDFTTLTSSQKKLFACAPNFYCADLTDSVYNDEVARYAASLDDLLNSTNHRYGQDANQLGRPLHYLGGGKALDADIISNIQDNATLTDAVATDFGICRPAKQTSSKNVVTQHSTIDASGRTDFISQIGSCDSSAVHSDLIADTAPRLYGCPALIDDSDDLNDGNYIHIQNAADNTYTYSADDLKSLRTQNACGAEATDTLNESAFSFIESLALGSLNDNIIEPTLAQDACLRRAGAVCHTNLDCFPNKLHADQTAISGLAFFGNTQAELKFFEEYLVCAQADPLPLLGTDELNTYDMTKNRCCREIGKDITLYTENDQFDVTSDTVLTDLLSVTDTNATDRYSRYSTIKNLGDADYPAPWIDVVLPITKPVAKQWKTIGETASGTCCGGGFIRKFSDGGHDWSNSNRLQIDISNMKCLNYNNQLVEKTGGFESAPNYSRDIDHFCIEADMTTGNSFCSQATYAPTSDNSVVNPSSILSSNGIVIAADPHIKVQTHELYTQSIIDVTGGPAWEDNINHYPNLAPYRPQMPSTSDVPYIAKDTLAGTVISKTFYIPAYMPTQANPFIGLVQVEPEPDGTYDTLSGDASVSNIGGRTLACGIVADITAVDPPPGSGAGMCIYQIDAPVAGQVTIEVNFDANVTNDISFQFEYIPMGLGNAEIGLRAGNDLYYLEKLARFEMLGIPQIAFDPIYCNWDKDELLTGLFKVGRGPGLGDWFADTDALIVGVNDVASAGTDGYITTSPDDIDHEPIFASNEFSCCLELGKETLTKDRCCSGFAAAASTTVGASLVCMLPAATDLNLYYNPFISSESMRNDLPIEFEDEDFDEYTGEVKIDANGKLMALAIKYCSSQTFRTGGAFGNFNGEPTPPLMHGSDFTMFGIVDSFLDNEANANGDRGFQAFIEGYRWNHHIYCAPDST